MAGMRGAHELSIGTDAAADLGTIVAADRQIEQPTCAKRGSAKWAASAAGTRRDRLDRASRRVADAADLALVIEE